MALDTFLLAHESAIRLAAFLSALALLAAWELALPRRIAAKSKGVRWANNAALAIVNIALVRVSFPLAAVALAAFVNERGTGLFNMFAVPYLVAVIGSLIAFDLAVYLVHLAFHTAPVLWRMHRVHHADPDLDVTTAVRFHPVQAVLSTLVKLSVILVLGTPILAVVLFETLFHALLLFNHTNVRLSPACDRALRWFIVTPDMHRVHHSARMAETNSNFGFALPWWDRLFGTYVAQPAGGHEAMTVGIGEFEQDREQWLDRLLLNPFLDDHSAAKMTSRRARSVVLSR